MDYTTIDQQSLGILAGMYMHGCFLFRKDLLDAHPRKQRRFHKWLLKQYAAELYELPEEISAQLFGNNSDHETVAFLSECHKEMERRLTQRRFRQKQLLEEFDSETAAALEMVLQQEDWNPPQMVGTSMKLEVENCGAFRRILILENAAGEDYEEWDYCESLDLQKMDGQYVLTGIILGRDLRISFSAARVQVDCFNPMDAVEIENPWSYLSAVSHRILAKLNLPEDYGNPQEREMFPLLEELAALSEKGMRFPLLAELARKHGFLKLGERLELGSGNGNFLIAKLCEAKHEPMWREIYDRLRESQSVYPKAVEVLCDTVRLTKERKEIQTVLEEQGYTGTWPLFEKCGRLDGIHLASSYGQSYFVFWEKKAVFRILCMERCAGEPRYDMLSAVAFPRKSLAATDIYSCTFNGKGARLFCHSMDTRWCKEDCWSPELLARIAVKKAELKPLTKEEKQVFYSVGQSGAGLFFWIFLLAGGLFGILMTAGFALIAVLMALIFGTANEIPELMVSVPWWQILAFCWIGFGGSMGVIEVLVSRK